MPEVALRGGDAEALPRGAPLARYHALFRELPPVTPEELRGRWEGLVLGPAWYRALFRALLVLGGLRGWVGKEFGAGGAGANLCRRRGRLVRRSRLLLSGPIASTVDGRPALVLRYADRTPLRLVRDELRRHGSGACLGLTYLSIGTLRRIRLPFGIAPVS